MAGLRSAEGPTGQGAPRRPGRGARARPGSGRAGRTATGWLAAAGRRCPEGRSWPAPPAGWSPPGRPARERPGATANGSAGWIERLEASAGLSRGVGRRELSRSGPLEADRVGEAGARDGPAGAPLPTRRRCAASAALHGGRRERLARVGSAGRRGDALAAVGSATVDWSGAGATSPWEPPLAVCRAPWEARVGTTSGVVGADGVTGRRGGRRRGRRRRAGTPGVSSDERRRRAPDRCPRAAAPGVVVSAGAVVSAGVGRRSAGVVARRPAPPGWAPRPRSGGGLGGGRLLLDRRGSASASAGTGGPAENPDENRPEPDGTAARVAFASGSPSPNRPKSPRGRRRAEMPVTSATIQRSPAP